jgi:hypothetical protein
MSMDSEEPWDETDEELAADEELPADEMDEYALEQRRREERRAVEEAGGGEAEGFELAEADLIEHASHGDEHSTEPIMRDAAGEGDEEAAGDADAEFGEADEEHKPD